MSLTERFCDVDDFCQIFLPTWQGTLLGESQRHRAFTLTPSEVMTILIHFHRSHYRNFNATTWSRSVWGYGVPSPGWSAIIALWN